MLRLKFTYQLKFICVLIVMLFFFNTLIILGQICHQDIVDKVTSNLAPLNTKLTSIDKAVWNKVSKNDNSYIIDNVQKLFDKLESKLDELSKVPSDDISDSELKSLEHLSNIEKDIKRLVQIMLAEKVSDKTESKSETLNEKRSPTLIEFGLGTDFGDSPNIQPYISISYSGFELVSWASYPFSAISSPDNELDLYFSYSHETENGDFGAALTDYYFPNVSINFSNWKSNS